MRLGRQSVQTTRCAYIDRETWKQPLVASRVRRLAINEPKRIARGTYAFYTLYRVVVKQTNEIFHILRQPGAGRNARLDSDSNFSRMARVTVLKVANTSHWLQTSHIRKLAEPTRLWSQLYPLGAQICASGFC